MKEEILDFIERRFSIDCHWLDGNCYYFAVILKERFPNAVIYYDVVLGHFCIKIDNNFYDWTGLIKMDKDSEYVEWDKMSEYDEFVKERIIRDCIN